MSDLSTALSAPLSFGAPSLVWVVCETSERWLMASRRFSDALTPRGMTMKTVSAHADNVTSMLQISPSAVVFWEVDAGSYISRSSQIRDLSYRYSEVLQIAAVSQISDPWMAGLSECGISITIRHPEHLPKLAGMIRRKFG